MTQLAKIENALTTKQARALTDKISRKMGEMWPLMREAYERKAWDALGYTSWREYVTKEFNVSQSRAYQLLDQARVVALIQDAANSTEVEISEREARAIKPVLREVTEEIKARIEAGEAPSQAIRESVKTTREAVEISTKVEKTKPAMPTIAPANDDLCDGPDLAELVDELQAENTRLTAMIQAAEADDLKAEAIKWRAAYERSLAAQSEAMDSAHASQKREKFSMTQLRRCGKAVGVDDPRHIAAAVEAMAKVKAAA